MQNAYTSNKTGYNKNWNDFQTNGASKKKTGTEKSFINTYFMGEGGALWKIVHNKIKQNTKQQINEDRKILRVCVLFRTNECLTIFHLARSGDYKNGLVIPILFRIISKIIMTVFFVCLFVCVWGVRWSVWVCMNVGIPNDARKIDTKMEKRARAEKRRLECWFVVWCRLENADGWTRTHTKYLCLQRIKSERTQMREKERKKKRKREKTNT